MGTSEIEGQLLTYWEKRDYRPVIPSFGTDDDRLKLHGADRTWDGKLYTLCDGPGKNRPVRRARISDLPLRICQACESEHLCRIRAAIRRAALAEAKRLRGLEK